MKIKITRYIEAPDGATHYLGVIDDDPEWWKTKLIANFPQWLFYHKTQRRWLVYGDNKPHWIKEIIHED